MSGHDNKTNCQAVGSNIRLHNAELTSHGTTLNMPEFWERIKMSTISVCI